MHEGIPVCLAVERMRPANNDQLLAYHYLHEHCDLLPQEEQLSYVKLQRSEQPTNVKRRKRESDDESDATDSDMPELQEDSEVDEPRKVNLEDDESDDGESDEEVEEQKIFLS